MAKIFLFHSPSAPDSSSRPGGILAILAANKPDHPGTTYRALKEQKKGSLSALLAANRAQAAAQDPLPAGVMLSEATITAANAAIGSAAGVVRASAREGLGVLGAAGGLAMVEGLATGVVSEKGAGGGGELEVRDGSAERGALKGGDSESGQLMEPGGSNREAEAAQPKCPVVGQGRSGGAGVSRGERSEDGSREEKKLAWETTGGKGAGEFEGAGSAASKDAQSREMRKRANAMEFLKQVGLLLRKRSAGSSCQPTLLSG